MISRFPGRSSTFTTDQPRLNIDNYYSPRKRTLPSMIIPPTLLPFSPATSPNGNPKPHVQTQLSQYSSAKSQNFRTPVAWKDFSCLSVIVSGFSSFPAIPTSRGTWLGEIKCQYDITIRKQYFHMKVNLMTFMMQQYK
jgi:hypothetical protein